MGSLISVVEAVFQLFPRVQDATVANETRHPLSGLIGSRRGMTLTYGEESKNIRRGNGHVLPEW